MYGFRFGNSFNIMGGGVSTDPDADAFITAASITDPTQQSAVNQLVVDLKAASIWTKMYALYPFVGGSSTSNSYNLKNTAQYQLSFSGGWTHNANGATSNGTNAYADTGLNISSSVSNWHTDSHLSIYCRTKEPSGNGFAMGVGNTATGDPLYGLVLARQSDTGAPSYYDFGNITGNGRISYSEFGVGNDARAFYIGITRANNNHKLFKNNTEIATSSLTVTGTLSNGTIHLGKYNATSGSNFYQGLNFAFASVGQQLSDSENTAFKNAVVTFQTTLSRNV